MPSFRFQSKCCELGKKPVLQMSKNVCIFVCLDHYRNSRRSEVGAMGWAHVGCAKEENHHECPNCISE
jgi:hypothetical protein